MRIVSPYKPYPESDLDKHHTAARLGDFDWIEALRMLADTASRFGHEVVALTDAKLPVPHIILPTRHQQLMIWVLEVSLRYLESDHFDQDSVFISPDSLFNAPLPDLRGADLGICARGAEKYRSKPILNSFQMWPVAAKQKLIPFYRECLRQAESMGGAWGADTLPLVNLLSPVHLGEGERHGLKVRFFSHKEILRTLRGGDIRALDSEKRPAQTHATLIDFKAGRKKYMVNYYRAVYENR